MLKCEIFSWMIGCPDSQLPQCQQMTLSLAVFTLRMHRTVTPSKLQPTDLQLQSIAWKLADDISK